MFDDTNQAQIINFNHFDTIHTSLIVKSSPSASSAFSYTRYFDGHLKKAAFANNFKRFSFNFSASPSPLNVKRSILVILNCWF
jgi:hypothetical protein